MTLIEKLNSYTPDIESITPIQYFHNGFSVTELFDFGIYSLLIIYPNDKMFSRGTFRRYGCKRYKDKRKTYIGELEMELQKLGIIY
jgi:hypothetical protein